MNKTIIAIIVKVIVTTIAAWITFGFLEDNSITWIILLGIFGSIMNYIIGDLLVLPKFGNFVASLGDGIMAGLLAYIFDLISEDFYITINTTLFFFILVVVFEYFFHKYLITSDNVAP